jgi:hypothetical protein
MGGAVVAVVAAVAEFGKDSSLNNIPTLFWRGRTRLACTTL